MKKPHAVLDACVLYPAPLRDFLLECAYADFYTAHWSEAIQAEWLRNLLVNRPDLNPDRLSRTIALMNSVFPQALTTGYEHWIADIILPDSDDRHVVAAAKQSQSTVIVTLNLRDFPARNLAAHGIIAQHPDTFLMDLLHGQRDALLQMVRSHRARLINPPKDAAEYVATLRQNQLKQIGDLFNQHRDEI